MAVIGTEKEVQALQIATVRAFLSYPMREYCMREGGRCGQCRHLDECITDAARIMQVSGQSAGGRGVWVIRRKFERF